MASPRPAAPVTGGAPSAAVLDPIRLIKQNKWLLLAATVVGVVIGLGLYFFFRQYSPSYRSSITYQASPPIAGVGAGQSLQVDDKELERFLATETRRMVSEPVLRAAVQDREVRETTQWIQQFMRGGVPDEGLAYRELVKIASARPITGTMYMTLEVSAPRREDAQILATAIHNAYFTDLTTFSTRVSTDQREPLSRRLNALREEINRLEVANRGLYVEAKLETTEQEQDGDMMALAQAQDRLAEARNRLTASKEEQDSLRKAADNPGGRQYNDTQRDQAERDPLVVQLKGDLAQVEATERAMIQTGKGEKNLDRIQVRARIDALREQIDLKRAEALDKIFSADVDSVERSVRQNDAIVRETEARVTELQTKRGQKAVAMQQVKDNENKLALLRTQEREVEGKLGEISMISEMKNTDRIERVRRVQSARLPESLAFPRWEMMIPLGVVLALGVTLTFLVLRELMDQRVRGPSDIGLIPRLRLLGIVPDAGEDPSRPENVETAFKDAPTGAVSEGFRQIRAPLNKRMLQAGYKTLLVAAGAPESGATATVANLAMQAAATDQRVLMIDANFRRPGLHKVFKLGEGPGLGDVLTKKHTLEQAVQQTTQANLTLLSAGSAAARAIPERLATESMTQLLAEAAAKYDLVIIDTAPAMVAGDAMSLANRVDSVILVVKALSEKRGYLARLRDQFADVKAELLGVVLNGVRGTAGGYLKKNIRTAHEYQTAGE